MPRRRKKYAQMVFNSYERPVVTSQFCKQHSTLGRQREGTFQTSHFILYTAHIILHTSQFCKTAFYPWKTTGGDISNFTVLTKYFTLHSLHFIHHTSQFCKTAFYPWKTTGGDISNFTDHNHNVRRQTMRDVT